MEIRQIRYYARTYETGSISRAAKELAVVQSALSYQILRLEDELGVRLLVRSAKGVVPTQAGEVFYQHSKNILGQIDQARVVARLKIVEPLPVLSTVTIGMAPTTTSMWGLKILKAFRTAHPHVGLNIVEALVDDVETMLLARKIDLAILFSDRLPKEIDHTLVVNEPFYLVEKGRGPNALKGGVSLVKAFKRPLILPSRLRKLRQQIDVALAKIGATPVVYAEIDSVHTIVQAVADGLAASVLPRSAISYVERGLSLYEIADQGLVRPNYLCSYTSGLLLPTIGKARLWFEAELPDLVG